MSGKQLQIKSHSEDFRNAKHLLIGDDRISNRKCSGSAHSVHNGTWKWKILLNNYEASVGGRGYIFG